MRGFAAAHLSWGCSTFQSSLVTWHFHERKVLSDFPECRQQQHSDNRNAVCPWDCPWITHGWVAQMLVVSAVEEMGTSSHLLCGWSWCLCWRSWLVKLRLVFACYSPGWWSACVEFIKTKPCCFMYSYALYLWWWHCESSIGETIKLKGYCSNSIKLCFHSSPAKEIPELRNLFVKTLHFAKISSTLLQCELWRFCAVLLLCLTSRDTFYPA